MDTNNTHQKSELDKFKLFYEYATPVNEVRSRIKQRTVRRKNSN